MTPAIRLLKKQKIQYKVHQYEHENSSLSFGEEAAQKLDTAPEKIFKTLVVKTNDDNFAVGVICVSSKLNLKSMAKALGVKKVTMADAKDVEKITGYILGGVSPLGQKKRLKTILDISSKDLDTIFVSGGKRGLDVELSPLDLQRLLNATFEKIMEDIKC